MQLDSSGNPYCLPRRLRTGDAQNGHRRTDEHGDGRVEAIMILDAVNGMMVKCVAWSTCEGVWLVQRYHGCGGRFSGYGVRNVDML